MECKIVPKFPETRVDLITKLEKKKYGTFCSRYGFNLCLVILFSLTLFYCFYLHYNYINVVKQLQKITDNSQLYEQPETIVKRHLEVERRRPARERNRRRRNDRLQNLEEKIKDLSVLPMVHLPGNRGLETTDGEHGCLYNQPCFLWKYPNHYYQSMFPYILKDDKVVGIKITRAGYYYVYSQISVVGLKNEENVPSNPAFGYETIKVAGQTSVILTRTYITQDQRGQWYSSSNGDPIKPLDSMNQMGIFILNCNDIIMVRTTEQLNIHNINFLQDPHQTYFGLVLLRPKGLNDYSCY